MAESELPQPPEHLSSEEFRKHGHALIDWIADYWDRIEDLPVESSVSPGSVLSLIHI